MRAGTVAIVISLLTVTASIGPVAAQSGEVTASARPTPTAEDFGYGSMAVDGGEARGVRPLLVVVIESPPVANKSGVSHNTTYYERLVFGYGDTALPVGEFGRRVSINELFIENSRGRFSWSKAGGRIFGPFTYPSTGAFVENGGFGDDGEFDTRRAVPELVAGEGFDFSRYDRDGDGTVSSDELGILVFDDRSEFGGQTIDICQRVETPDSGRIRVCTGASGVGHRASLSLVAHELGHQLGSPHYYGSNLHLKSRTIMGPSTGPDNLDVFHFDPWTKVQLGWARPRIYSIPELREEGACAFPGKLSNSGLFSDRDPRTPVILYDPERYDPSTRSGEYYVLEWRFATSYDYGIRGSFGGSGLAVWYVQTEDGLPRELPALIRGDGPSAFDTGRLDSRPDGDDVLRDGRIYPGPNGVIDTTVARGIDGEALDSDPIPTDVMNLLVGPGTPEMGAPWNYTHRGNPPLWRPADDDARLRWFDDSFIGIPIDFELEYRTGPVINLNTREMHIDAGARRTVTAEPGGEIDLYGHFVPESRRGVVRIARDGHTVAELDRRLGGVGSWACDRLHLNIPSDLASGEYELYALDPTTGVRSDPVTLLVREEVDAGSWCGTYTGRVDGRAAELTLEPAAEFDLGVELRDLDRDVTFRGTTTGPTTNVLHDITLRSEDGRTREIDTVYLQGGDRLSGSTQRGRDDFGFAFSTDASEWDAGGPALASGRATWSRQWLGTYEGYVDDDGAELRILDVEFAGLGYVYDVELEDAEGVVYRGRGSVLLDSPHVMRFGRSLTNTTTFTLGGAGGSGPGAVGIPGPEATATLDSVRLPRLLLYSWDTDYVSGWVADGAYGSAGVGAYFVRRPGEIPPDVRGLVERYNANAGSAPEALRSVFGDQRIDLVVTSTAHPIEPGDGNATASRVRKRSQAVYGVVTGDPQVERVETGGVTDPTMTVRIRREHLREIAGADDPGTAFTDYYRSDLIEVEPASLGNRVTFGASGVASNLAARFGGEAARYPNPAVRRLGSGGDLSRNAGLVRQDRVVRLGDDTPVAGYAGVRDLKDDLKDAGGGPHSVMRLMRAGAGLADKAGASS